MKKKFFSTRTKLITISFVVIALLEAIALPLGFAMLKNSELNIEKKQKEEALTSLSTSFDEDTVGSLLRYDHQIFTAVYENFEGVTLTPGSEQSEAYFKAFEQAKLDRPIIGMTQAGTYRNLILSSLKTTLVPSSSSYLYLAIYDPSINIAVVSMGAAVSGNKIYTDSVREGYFFQYDYPRENSEFKTFNHEYKSPYKGDLFINVCEIEYRNSTDNDENSLRYLVISEVETHLVYDIVNSMTLKYFLITLITGVTLLGVFILLTHFFFSKKIKILSSTSSIKSECVKNGIFEKQFKLHNKLIFDEIDVLNDDLYYLEDELHKYFVKVEENIKIAEKKLAEDELSSKIQLSSLPSKIIHDKHISITPIIKPAKAVGGDLYDYFYIDKNRFAFFIGDVSGKGVPAALFMMKANTLIKHALLSIDNILDAIKYVNEQLMEYNDAFLFITAFFGVVNIKENTLTYVSAGHEKPLINRGSGYQYLDVDPNIPLGVSEYEFVDGKIELNEGDTLFMYTDGVSEAKDRNDNLFGYDRIAHILNANHKEPDLIISNRMIEEIEKFNHGHEQDDDICMLSFKYKSPIITISNKTEELQKVKEFIDEKTSFVKDEAVISELHIIVDELVSNIIHYAYKEEGDIDVSINFDDEYIYLYLVDSGIPFNPFDHVEERGLEDIGGLGISLVKTLSNSYEYRFVKGHNFVTITKKYKCEK